MKKIRIAAYFEALLRFYLQGGGKYVDRKILDERFRICSDCEHFTGLKCDLCGCCSGDKQSHFNKLAFPTESCPEDRWHSV